MSSTTDNTTSPAAVYYNHQNQARDYTTLGNEHIQRELTQHAWNLRQLSKFQNQRCYTILDIGCGSGLSLNVLCNEEKQRPGESNYDYHVVGFDVSTAMLRLASKSTTTCDVYLANAGQKFPLRPQSVDLMLSISMLQWLERPDEVLRFFQSVFESLVPDHGHGIFQGYPVDAAQVDLWKTTARAVGFHQVHWLMDYPHVKSVAKKWFFIVSKAQVKNRTRPHASSSSQTTNELKCPLAERFRGTCAIHYWENLAVHDSVQAAHQVEKCNHLYSHHIQIAHHIVRRVRRSERMIDEKCKMHPKARASLEILAFEQQLVDHMVQHEWISRSESKSSLLEQLQLHQRDITHAMHSIYSNLPPDAQHYRMKHTTSEVVLRRYP